jgi:hypothetical protein
MAMDTPIETRYLLAAVILGEELSFTAAAKRLKMSQSGVSRRLSELEHRCGVKLFDLNNANVLITAKKQNSLSSTMRALEHGKAANEGAESQLTIGRSPYLDPLITSALFSIRLPPWPSMPSTASPFAACSPTTDAATAPTCSAALAPNSACATERFIQTALREWAYVRHYLNSEERDQQLSPWLQHYNFHRPHGSLVYAPPISRTSPVGTTS